MQALILAGGQGTRLRPLTDLYPKPLLYLPGGRLIDYILAQVEKIGIRDVGVVVHYAADKVVNHVTAIHPSVTVIPQTPPYTLVGALASAGEWVSRPTLVLHADNYFSFSLRYFVGLAPPDVATFLVDRPDDPDPVRRVASSGAYVLPPHAFRIAADVAQADNLADLVQELYRRQFPVFSIPVRGWRCNVNQPADLLRVNHYLLSRWHDAEHPRHANLGYDPMMLSWIAPDACLEESHIGLYVTVGEGAVIRRSTLHNALVFPGAEVEDFEGENTILVETAGEIVAVYVPSYVVPRIA